MLTDLPFDLFILMLRIVFIFLLYFFLFQVVRVVSRELQAPPSSARPAESAAKPGTIGTTPPVLTIVDANQSGLAVGTTFTLESVSTIGRTSDNVVPLPDAFVSGHHARLVHTSGRWYLTDLGSTNGTFVNGHRVGHSAAMVKDSDILQIGRVKLRLTVY